MKKLILALSLIMFASVAINAQACAKTDKKACAKTCAKTADKTASADTKVASAMSEAQLAASTNENIEVRECPMSGKVSYYEKAVCEKSGSVSWSQVEYDAESKTFTRVASASAESELMNSADDTPSTDVKKACSADCKKACCADKASAVNVKGGEKKACCSKGAKKACTAEKKAEQ